MSGLADFIGNYLPTVQETAKKYNIFPSVILTQAGQETTWGSAANSCATDGDNNLFGITYGNAGCHDPELSTRMGHNSFCHYESFEDSIKDYGYFMCNSSIFGEAMKKSTPEECLSAIADAGYCTDPSPAEYKKLILDMFNNNNFKQYDEGYSGGNPTDSGGNSSKNPEKPKWNLGWNMNTVGWFYITDNTPGAEVFYTFKDGWQKIDGKWYLFDDKGYAYQNSWYTDSDGSIYCFDNNCNIVLDSWILSTRDDKWHMADKEGKIIVDKWIQYENAFYYLGHNGTAYQNEWLKYNGDWYHFDKDATMQTNAWVPHNKQFYYIGSDGKMVKNQKLVIDNIEYTFDEYGVSDKKYQEV